MALTLFRTHNRYQDRHTLHTLTCGTLRRLGNGVCEPTTYIREQVSGPRLREILSWPNLGACNCVRGLVKRLTS